MIGHARLLEAVVGLVGLGRLQTLAVMLDVSSFQFVDTRAAFSCGVNLQHHSSTKTRTDSVVEEDCTRKFQRTTSSGSRLVGTNSSTLLCLCLCRVVQNTTSGLL